MRTIITLLPLALLAACGSEQSGTVTDKNGETTNFTIDTDSGTSEVRATGSNGEEVVINTAGGAGTALPLGFTTYPGADVVSNSTITTNDGAGSVLFMQTSDRPEAVMEFYKKQAAAAGIAIALESNTNGARTIAGEGADGKNFMMTATTGDGGTGVQLMVGTKPGG